MLTAITRKVSPALKRCELSYIERQPIDLEKAEEQHRAYEALLEELGARVISLPPEPELPDSMFVEDPAIVMDGLAAQGSGIVGGSARKIPRTGICEAAGNDRGRRRSANRQEIVRRHDEADESGGHTAVARDSGTFRIRGESGAGEGMFASEIGGYVSRTEYAAGESPLVRRGHDSRL